MAFQNCGRDRLAFGLVVAPMLTERGETLAKILTRIQGQSLSHTSSLVMPAVAAVLGGEADEI